MASQKYEVLQELTTSMRTGRMTRRTFLQRSVAVGISSAAALSLLEACGSSGASSANITYWNLFGGGDGVRMVEMQDNFQKTYPSIPLEAITLAWGAPYYTKLAMAAVGGKPPDVGIMHLSRMLAYAQGNLLDPFDLNELAQFGITQDNFLPNLWDRVQYNGKVYAIPLDTHPFVMYYNVDVAKKAGLLDTNGRLKTLQGKDEVIAAFKAAQQVTGSLGLSTTGAWRLFDGLYAQLGGSPILSKDGRTLTIDDAKAEQALAFMADLTTGSKVASPTLSADYAGSVAVFGSGKAGFFWNGEWEVTTFLGEKMHFDMVPFPNMLGGNQTFGDSHSFVLPRQANVNNDQRRAALQFISFMLKNSYTWAEGGHIPAYQPVVISDKYKQLSPQSHYADVAQYVVPDPSAWFSGAGSQFETVADGDFQTVLLGQLKPQEALQQFKSSIQKLLNTPPPVGNA